MKFFKRVLPFSVISLGAMASKEISVPVFLSSSVSSLPIGTVVPEKYSDFLNDARKKGCSVCCAISNDSMDIFFMTINPLYQSMHFVAHENCYTNCVPVVVKNYIDSLNKKYSGKNMGCILLANQISEALRAVSSEFKGKSLKEIMNEGGADRIQDYFIKNGLV
jgi:hypothetical protein